MPKKKQDEHSERTASTDAPGEAMAGEAAATVEHLTLGAI